MKNLIILVFFASIFCACNQNDKQITVVYDPDYLPENVLAPVGHMPYLGDMFNQGEWIEMAYYTKCTKRSQLMIKCDGVREYTKVMIEHLDAYPEGIKEGDRTFEFLDPSLN